MTLLHACRATPCIIFHITATVPAIWVMELTETEIRMKARRENTTSKCIDVVLEGRKGGFVDITDWVCSGNVYNYSHTSKSFPFA